MLLLLLLASYSIFLSTFFSPTAIGVHFALVTASFLLLLYITAPLLRRKSGFSHSLFSMTISFYYLLLGNIYIIQIVGFNIWKKTFTLKKMYDSLEEGVSRAIREVLGNLLELLHLSNIIPATLTLGVIIYFIGNVLAFYLLYLYMRKIETNLLQRLYECVLHMKKAIVASCCYLVAAITIVHLSVHTKSWAGEPIIGLFVKPPDFVISAHSKKIEKADAAFFKEYTAGESFNKKNVILIVSDSLRPTNMGAYDYHRETTPYISSLVDQGKLNRIDFSASSGSASSVSLYSILGSKTTRNISYNITLLDSLLKKLGYTTIIASSFTISKDDNYESFNTFMTNRDNNIYSSSRVIEGKINTFNEFQTEYFNNDKDVIEALKLVPESSHPTFFLIWLASSHDMGHKIEQYRKYHPSVLGVTRGVKALPRETIINTYDNSLLQYDDMVKNIMTVLEEKGYLEDSIVVMTGDHGEALGDKGKYGHISTLDNSMIRVPLLISTHEGSHLDQQDFGRQIDIAPTILDSLGLPNFPGFEGQSLLQEKKINESVHMGTPRFKLRAVFYRDGERLYKLLYSADDEIIALYDVFADPDELDDLLPNAAQELIDKMLKLMAHNPLTEHSKLPE